MMSIIVKYILIGLLIVVSMLCYNMLISIIIDKIVRDSNSVNTIKTVKRNSNVIMRITRLCMWNMKTTRPIIKKCFILLLCNKWFIICPLVIICWIYFVWFKPYSDVAHSFFVVSTAILYADMGVAWLIAVTYGNYIDNYRDKYFRSRKRKK